MDGSEASSRPDVPSALATARIIRCAFLVSLGLYIIYSAFLRYLNPPTDSFADRGFTNVLAGGAGVVLVWSAYAMYRRRNTLEPRNQSAVSPRSASWIWLVGAALMLFGMFWPLDWRLSFDWHLVRRFAIVSYCLFEAQQAYTWRDDSVPDTADSDLGLKIMGAVIIAFGVVAMGFGLVEAELEWAKTAQWPRTTGLLVDEKISTVGAWLDFDYEVNGVRTSGRAYRWGTEGELRALLVDMYRVGNRYGISYKPKDPTNVEFDLGYHWDRFRLPIGILILGGLFALTGFRLGAPWRGPRRVKVTL